jgi:hypothetical protein
MGSNHPKGSFCESAIHSKTSKITGKRTTNKYNSCSYVSGMIEFLTFCLTCFCLSCLGTPWRKGAARRCPLCRQSLRYSKYDLPGLYWQTSAWPGACWVLQPIPRSHNHTWIQQNNH